MQDSALKPENIRLGLKGRAVANTLSYDNTATIMAVKRFIVQTQVNLKNPVSYTIKDFIH